MRLPPLSSPPIRLRAIPLLLTALTSLLIIQLDGGTPPWGMEGYGGGSTSWNLGNAARGTLSRYARPRGIGAAANNRTQPAGKRSDRIRIGTGVGLAASPEHVDEIRKLVQALSQDSPDSTAGLIVFRAEPTDSESTASLSSPGLPAGCPIQSYGNPYPLGVCTWYAKEKRPDLPSFSFPYALALNWPEAAELCGFRVDRQPAPGAVIVYPPGANGAWSGGHVGYVEEVGADYLLTSECNINHSSGWAVAPLWWEAGYECGFKHIPFAQLDPRVIYIHRRVAPPAPPSPEDTATTRTTEPPSLQPRFQ
jgi:surface antigen